MAGTLTCQPSAMSKRRAVLAIVLLSLGLWTMILGLFMAMRHALTLVF